MLLLNLVRAIIVLLALLLLHTFEIAYNLSDVGRALVGFPIGFVALCVISWSDATLIDYFNKDDSKA